MEYSLERIKKKKINKITNDIYDKISEKADENIRKTSLKSAEIYEKAKKYNYK